MSTQQLRVVELVEAIRRKRLRNENPTHLTGSTPVFSNWGNKLKRSAQHVELGHLDNPRGAETQSENILYNGYKRRIISRNPLLVDEDGDIADEGDENDLDLEPIEEDPYKDIRIEDILQPLTSAADLHSHPRMARPFVDKGLEEMIRNTEKAVRKEQKILAAMNELLIKARGDHDWAPVETMHTSYDDALLLHALTGTPAVIQPQIANGISTIEVRGEDTRHGQRDAGQDEEEELESPGKQLQLDSARADEAISKTNGENNRSPKTNGDGHTHSEQPQDGLGADDAMAVDVVSENGEDDDTPAHRMTTRAQLSATHATSQSPSPPPIHPFYKPPPRTLKPPEDETLVPLLQYVSKQEEVVRLQNGLYQNLLRALRMRKEVWTWAKAEGHVGEMSDGEDWVDLDAWGLVPGELTKGKEEDEQEVVNEGPGRRGRRGGRGAGDR